MVCVIPVGKVRRLPHSRNQLFYFSPHPLFFPCFAVPLLSFDLAFFSFSSQTSRLLFAIMLPGSFASLPDSYPLLVLEGLCRKHVAISATPSPPAAGYSLRRTSALVQGMQEVLSTFSGQEVGELACFVVAYCS